MLKDLYRNNLRAIPNKKVDKGRLRKFIKLAQYLRFKSLKIIIIKKYPYSTTTAVICLLLKLILVTSGRREIKGKKYGLPRKKVYVKDNKYLYLNNIYNLSNKDNKNIMSFFVRRSVFFTFYNKYP